MARLGNPIALAAMASNLTPKQKQVLAISAVAILAIGGYAIYRGYKKFWKGHGTEEEKAIRNTLKEFKVDMRKATINEGTAMNLAQQLFDAMNQVGTDTATIFRIFQRINNEHDLFLIYKAFDVRHYGRWGESVIQNDFFSTPLDLIGWLKRELKEHEQNTLRNTFDRLNFIF